MLLPIKPENFCFAPFVHTYLSPAQNFEQYIDTKAGTGKYIPITLDAHWNSDHMKSVRVRMIAGETLPECEVCNDKLLNTSVYRSYFESMFGHKYLQAIEATDETGYTTMICYQVRGKLNNANIT